MNNLFSIYRGVVDMILLRTSWCDHIGNSGIAFLFALFINILAIPLGAWFAQTDGQGPDLSLRSHVFIEGIMLAVMVITIFLLAFCRFRMQKFSVVYAGITYSGVLIALILMVVEWLMALYGHSLYSQQAPMLAHALLVGALIWMVILTSFVFKTGLEIGFAASVMMTTILLFVAFVGRYVLEVFWLNYL